MALLITLSSPPSCRLKSVGGEGGRFTLTNVIVGKNRRGLKMDIPNGIDTGSVLITGDFLSIV